ncbi:zinc finger protein 271-like [Patiria miniata]|uniref:C2H2-type domain-containing protein n=1 Tax=Patiria miniata TaxID=46514 RepID=A0A913ZF50_PATMI|nr:zinc finger protein 271-like [Patiria miniata]
MSSVSKTAMMKRTIPVKRKRSCFICGRASFQKFCMAHQWHEKKEGPKHVCPVCNKVFKDSSNLKRHRRIHTREKPGVGVVREHCYSQTESGLKPFLCDVCGQTFSAKKNLLKHQKKIHDFTMPAPSRVEKIPYDCDSCGKRFTKRSVMSRHSIRMHSTERPFRCSFCEKTFAQTCDLVRHERVHRRERPFICDVCGRRFLRRHHLQDHMLTHTRARSYLCDGCGQTFIRKGNFVNHRTLCSQITGSAPSQDVSLSADQQNNHTSTGQADLETGILDQASYLDSVLQQTGVAQPVEQTSTPDTLSQAITQSLGIDFTLFEKVTANGKRYMCDFCNKECTSMHEFSRHRRTHTKERPFLCKTCGKRFKQTSHLVTHRVTHTKERAYKCEICGHDFALRNSFVRHCKKMHGIFPEKTVRTRGPGPSAPLETSDTNQQENQVEDNDQTAQNEAGTGTLDLLNQPTYIYYQQEDQEGVDKTLQTEAATALVDFLSQASDWSSMLESTPSTTACDTTMGTSAPNQLTDYASFRKTLAGGMRYVCNFCSKGFVKKFDLVRHRRIHLKQKPFACDTCGKRFTQKRHLVDHQPTHSKIKSFVCGNCGKAFAHGASLRYHRRKPCSRPPPTDQSSDSQSQPKEKVQPIDGRYFCDQCDKHFSQRYGLERHKLGHTSTGKPFACEICDKRFSQKDHVRKHRSVHTQVAPADKTVYICETCGKCLVSRKGLTLHKKTHIDDDRWYVCDICGTGFVEKRCLKEHCKTHPVKTANEKRFKCDACGKAFFYKQSLSKHLKRNKNTCSTMNKQSPEHLPDHVPVQDTE